MAFIDKIRRALGLDDNIEDEETILADATPPARPRDIYGTVPRNNTVNQPRPVAPAAEQTAADAKDDPVTPEDGEHICPEGIFNTVVNLFDNSLPQFVAASVDREAQCAHIYELLDESMRKYIADITEDARRRGHNRFNDERQKMLAEIEQLRQTNRSVKESGDSYKQQQLSAERQKRALNERIRDLEEQISTLNADREQFELENKSLINKVRLMSVQEGDAEALRTENNDLRAQIQKLRAGDISDETSRLQAEIDEAKASLATTQSELEAARAELETATASLKEVQSSFEVAQGESAGLRARLNSLTHDREQLQTAYDELKSKQEMTDVMINDLNAKASDALHELSRTKSELQTATATGEQLEQLRRQCDNLQQSNTTLRAEAERGKAALSLLADVQVQLDEFERSKRDREERITRLLDDLDSKDRHIDNLRQQLSRATATIDKLKSGHDTGNDADSEGDYFDPSLDDTDWLVSTPPPGTDARTPGVPDSEFGYQEPRRRRQAPNDPAQMSLFD